MAGLGAEPSRAAGHRRNHELNGPANYVITVSCQHPGETCNIYQMITSRGRQCGVAVHPHRFRHHFSHAWLNGGGPEGDLMELNGWASPQMLRRYGASARSARARRT